MSGPTRAPCDSCGTPEGVIYFYPAGNAEHFCSRCAQRYALYTAAYEQLEHQIRRAVEAWLPIWGNLPGITDLGEQLNQIGHKLQDEFAAGHWPAEGVQPASAEHLSNAAD